MVYELRGKIDAHFIAHDWFDMLRMRIAEDPLLAPRAETLGMQAAIRSEEYAAAHPAEIARRRRFFRQVPEECYFKGGEQKV